MPLPAEVIFKIAAEPAGLNYKRDLSFITSHMLCSTAIICFIDNGISIHLKTAAANPQAFRYADRPQRNDAPVRKTAEGLCRPFQNIFPSQTAECMRPFSQIWCEKYACMTPKETERTEIRRCQEVR